MMRASGKTGDGRPLLVIGLERENIERLKAGRPIKFDMAQHGIVGECIICVRGYGRRLHPHVHTNFRFRTGGANNAITNLRCADDKTNMRNKALYRNNRAGHANIQFRKGSWSVRFKVNGRSKCFGSYPTLEEALNRREQVRNELGFHKNHGRAA